MTIESVRLSAVAGRSEFVALKRALTPRARRSPPIRPTIEASTPMMSASRATEPRIWRRDAPIVRRVANSRMRCATVIDSVLKMTNAPTKSATPANESRK
jgi:hypothetical protein